MEENDYNLNIPRYVDTFDSEEAVDLDVVVSNLAAVEKTTTDADETIRENCTELGLPFPAGHNRSLLEAYKKGVMQQIFSQALRFKDDHGNEFPDWEEKKLGDVARIYDGTHMTPEYTAIGVPFYSVEHLTRGSFEQTKFISEEVFEKENKRVKLERGDILMTRIGDIGTSKHLDWDVRASFYVSLALIKIVGSDTSPEFLHHSISSSAFQRELWQRTIHVAFPKKINLGEIGQCPIELPSLPEQTKIANFLTALDRKIESVAHQITHTQAFKRGLLQQMFV